MSQRCPDALFVGKGYLKGCELVFRGNDQNAVAMIESKEILDYTEKNLFLLKVIKERSMQWSIS